MATHFLGYVRTRYNIPTSELSEEFESRLAYKSGYPLDSVKQIVEYINSIETKPSISDDELLSFNSKIEQFYKQFSEKIGTNEKR